MANDGPQNESFAVSWSQPESGPAHPGDAPQISGYRIEGRPLGEGGMGKVWRAFHLRTRRYVALKVLKTAARDPAKAQGRFEREVHLAAQLRDRRIVQVYDSGVVEGTHYYAMELVEGLPLDRFVANRQFGQRQILELMGQVADVVEYAHLKNVIHRDLKPSNILVTNEGEPRILDFGLAKMDSGDGDTEVSIAGEVLGTPAYMSPEQAAGRTDEVDRRSDVYSLGVILFCLLTGEHPHGSIKNKIELMQRIAGGEIRRPREVNPRLDKDLEKILLAALARAPGERYATAAAMASDIRNYLAGRPVSAGDQSATYILKKVLWRHRRPVALTLLVLAVLIGAGIAAYVRVRHERDRAVIAENTTSRQTVIAEQARQQAVARAEQLQRALYFSRITLAHGAFGKSNLGHMRELLALCPAELRNWEWRYLDRLAHRSEREIATGQERVCAVAFSPTGDLIATGAWDGTIKLWNPVAGTLAAQLPTDEHSLVYSVAFSPDGKRLVSGHFNDVVLWDVLSRARIRTLEGHNSIVHRVRFSPDGTRVASIAGIGLVGEVDNSLRLWDATTGKELLVLHPDQSEALDCSFSPDGKRIASAGRDGIAVWDVATGKRVRILDKTSVEGAHVEYSPDGTRIASSSGKAVKVWDASNEKKVLSLSGHDRDVTALSFSPGGTRLVSGTADGTLCIWDIARHLVQVTLPAHAGSVQAVAFHPQGRIMTSVGSDNILKLWKADMGNDRVVLSTSPQEGTAASLAFSPGGNSLACAGSSTSISLWNLPSGKSRQDLHDQQSTDTNGVTGAVAWSADGSRVAHGSGTTIIILDAATNGPGIRLEAAYLANVVQTMKSLSFRSDGRFLLSLDVSHALQLWDLVGRQRVSPLDVSDRQFTCATYAPRSHLIATGDQNQICIWEDTTAQPIMVLEDPALQVDIESVAFSPDETLVAAASGKSITLWAWRANQKRLSFTGHADRINAVAFSPDGTRLTSASADHTIRLWDTQTGEEALVLSGHDHEVLTVAFSRDGQKIASGDTDGKIIIWSIAGRPTTASPRSGDTPRQATQPGEQATASEPPHSP